MNDNGSSGNNFDYEYIPPRTAEDGRQQQLSSSSSTSSRLLTSTYPPHTPAGLRGEAVRSAIRSCCLGWNFQNTVYECGIVPVIATTSSSSSSSSSLLTFLNGKFTQYINVPSSSSSLFNEASFLNGKGQIIDKISIAIPSSSSSTSHTNHNKAYLMTSPGHSSQSLYDQLDPFIFPLDQIKLVSISKSSSSSSFLMFHLLSSQFQSVQDCYTKYILSQLPLSPSQQELYHTLPLHNQCVEITFPATNPSGSHLSIEEQQEPEQQMTLLILPSSGLLTCAGYGYTFCFWTESSSTSKSQQQLPITSPHIGHSIWQYIISEQCVDGPIEIGTLEYDTLRIECGQPLYQQEMTARVTKQQSIPSATRSKISPSTVDVSTTNTATPASPLELGLDYTIDLSKNKGCYQGQEGIASILKNPRGPPRTLYQVIFEDDINIYDYQSEGESTSLSSPVRDVENLTRTPQPNDALYVLGSNEEIMVGRITSVAEPSGTGIPITIALALVRRADSIQSSMKQMGIDRPTMFRPPNHNSDDDDDGYNMNKSSDNNQESSILIPPPSLDVLDGLEVIIGGTYTIGTLRMIPSRRSRNGSTKFLFSDDDIPTFVQNLPSEQDMYDLVPLTKLQDDTRNNNQSKNDDEYNESRTPSKSSTTPIQNAVIVPDRTVHETSKVDHWDDSDDITLGTRSSVEGGTSLHNDDDEQQQEEELLRAMEEANEAAQEAQRKAAKLEVLRQRAEEAMARRKQKQQQQQLDQS